MELQPMMRATIVADALNISLRQVYRLWDSGQLAFKIEPKLPGRKTRIRYSTPADINRYLIQFR